jgi:membrane protein involved in colicin uptake
MKRGNEETKSKKADKKAKQKSQESSANAAVEEEELDDIFGDLSKAKKQQKKVRIILISLGHLLVNMLV